jgi:hypothetical protein
MRPFRQPPRYRVGQMLLGLDPRCGTLQHASSRHRIWLQLHNARFGSRGGGEASNDQANWWGYACTFDMHCDMERQFAISRLDVMVAWKTSVIRTALVLTCSCQTCKD